MWAFTTHLARARKASALGVAYLYIAGGLLGALLSVNLSTALPATGAPAAVCALIGEPYALPPACPTFITPQNVTNLTLLVLSYIHPLRRCCSRQQAVHEDRGAKSCSA